MRRVLLIEDNHDAAQVIRLILELTGHEVRVAHDGCDALEQARAFRPEVVVCDIGLPGGMDGYAVAQAMRGDPALAPAQLIALTGYGQESDRQRALAAGFDMHVTKPPDPETLTRLVAEGPKPD